jgi:uncharacterized phage protein (TIGR02218 family)
MRTIPAGLAAHLAGAATTTATCWIVRRTDGLVFGFTDHDRPLAVDGVSCEPATGFDRSAATRGAGFAVGEEEIAGALSSAAIDEADLAAGRWDGARVEVHLVNWQTPAERLHLRTGTIGEVTRADGAFRAEVRGPAHALGQPTGRLFTRTCDAELGDARCGVALPPLTLSATVVETDAAGRIRVADASAFAARWFAYGRLAVTAGPSAGLTMTIEDHLVESGATWLVLRRPPTSTLAAGTAVSLTAGCDKRFATCREKFANAEAFRGFPHVPGRDFAFSYVRGDGRDDGGVLFG